MSIEFYCGILGLFVLPFIAWGMSSHKSHVMWKTVLFGLGIQLGLGLLVMLTRPGQLFFRYMNDIIIGLLKFSDEGSRFLFGQLVDPEFAEANFAFSVLSTIIFFSSIMSILYYTGIMQKVVEFVAWVMMKLLGTSGAETLSVSSNIFVGQTEAPLVVKPFIKNMTQSELNTIMTGGFATVAGGVMAAYVGLLHDAFSGIAGHLMTASIMSAPAAIVMSKLTLPERSEPRTGGNVEIKIENQNSNVIEAAASGAKTGLTLALNVGAMLLAFIALVHLGNFIVGWSGKQIHRLVTELRGIEAFQWGFFLGIGFMLFVVGRSFWPGTKTKFWIGGISLLFFSALTGFYFFPFPVVSMAGGLILALIILFTWQNDRIYAWVRSLFVLISGGVVFGIFAWLVGGTESSPLSGAFSAGLFTLLCVVPFFWQKNSVPILLRILLVTGLIAVVSGIVVGTFHIDFLQVLNRLTLEKLFGYVFSVLAFLMGVPWEDLVNFGQLIGHKIVVNEFVAFMEFERMAAEGLIRSRSMVIASYALTGFANFSSIAIQIGGIGGIAPSREKDLAKLGLRAMAAGALASFQTAAVAGVMFSIADKIGINLVNLGTSL